MRIMGVNRMTIETKICPNGHRIHVNPKKHQNRDKLCPKCGGRLSGSKKGWEPNSSWRKSRIIQRIFRVKRDLQEERLKKEIFMLPQKDKEEILDELSEVEK